MNALKAISLHTAVDFTCFSPEECELSHVTDKGMFLRNIPKYNALTTKHVIGLTVRKVELLNLLIGEDFVKISAY